MQRIDGAFWCYPAVIVGYWVLSTLPFVISICLVLASVAVLLDVFGALQRRLAEEAITDPLTGAFNRRHMERCLATAIERRNRTAEPASVLIVDVDHFKQINDAFGHAAGDGVLKALVALVAGRARKLDVLFRIGGEEFLLLLAGARQADALAVAEDLRTLVEDAELLDGTGVSISIGVSELRSRQSVSSWIADADAALYRAKQGGRNRVAGRALAAV